jgi:ABC-type phosphate/phosphonate transport system ATPase subunit
MIHNRYPGPKPFPEDYRSVFFGRDKEIGELLRMVRREPWLVLYGKSGQGKSSLLNAGLAPLLLEKDKMQSVFIRFNACPPEARDEEELHPYRGSYFLIENKWTLTKGNKPVEKAFDSILSLRPTPKSCLG